MVAPYDVDGMAAAMKRLLQDQSLREQMKSKGLERVSHFSTEISARKTLDAYMELFASHQQFK
jgi:glycosyltransferase involved in cell wall biosynthesis